MSKLESTDFLHCMYCNSEMKEILLCKSRCLLNHRKQRCHIIVCEDCEYCDGCEHDIVKLFYELKKCRFGKDNQSSACQWIVDSLASKHDIIVTPENFNNEYKSKSHPVSNILKRSDGEQQMEKVTE